MSLKKPNPTTLIHQILTFCASRQQRESPGLYIDATAGRGRDTLFLCRLAQDREKETGRFCRVLAFDIQREALESTAALLKDQGIPFVKKEKDQHSFPKGQSSFPEEALCSLILDTHENLADYALPQTADLILFNFGYLPGGDHAVATRPSSSLRALEAALGLLKKGGLLSLCIYQGGHSGYQEKEALLAWLEKLDRSSYTALVLDFANRPGDPPIPAFVLRHV